MEKPQGVDAIFCWHVYLDVSSEIRWGSLLAFINDIVCFSELMERGRCSFFSLFFLEGNTHQKVIGGCSQRHEETHDFLSAGAGGLGVSLRVTVTACARGHALPTCPPARQHRLQHEPRTTSTDSASCGLALNVSYFITVRARSLFMSSKSNIQDAP